MTLPRVAIVGRPNVGKSSLLNMLAKARVSIVDPTPGVTRDRVTAIVQLEAPIVRGRTRGDVRLVEFVDTGGFGVYTREGGRFDEIGNDLSTLTEGIEAQIAAAVESADLVLFAVDAQAGVTPRDREIATLLREQRLGKGGRARSARRVPVRVIATKVDGPRWEAHASELAGLGFGEPLMVSAKNNYMRRELVDDLYDIVPHARASGGPATLPDAHIAIIGKRNAGKSTLVNTLCGEPRMIVSEIPGTTRDAVDVHFEFDGRKLAVIDTAGLRRKKSFQDQIEWYAFDRLKLSVDRADVVMLLIDATEPISQVDEQIAMIAQKAFKPVVIVVNKWDLAQGKAGPTGKPVTPEDYEAYVRDQLRGLPYAPLAFMSASSGLNVRPTVRVALNLAAQACKRVTTGRLNRLIRPIIEARGPANKLGTFAKVYYVSQTGTNPPTISLVVNRPDLFTPNYERFLVNRLREELPFGEVPIRLQIRARRRDEEFEGAEGKRPAKGARRARARAGKVEDAIRPPGIGPGEGAEAYFEDDE